MTDKIRRVSYYEDIESLTRNQNSSLIQDFFTLESKMIRWSKSTLV